MLRTDFSPRNSAFPGNRILIYSHKDQRRNQKINNISSLGHLPLNKHKLHSNLSSGSLIFDISFKVNISPTEKLRDLREGSSHANTTIRLGTRG